MGTLKRYQWFGAAEHKSGADSICGQAETGQELREVVTAFRQSQRAAIFGVPEYNDVLDLEERRWLTRAEVKTFGLSCPE